MRNARVISISRGALVLAAVLMFSIAAWGANNNPLLLGGPNALPRRTVGRVRAAAPSGAHLVYYGGRVVSNMQVVQVLWGTGTAGGGSGQFLAQVRDTTTPSMATFYQQVLNSPYVDWLTEYNTDIIDHAGHEGTNQIIGHGEFSVQVAITPSDHSNPIDDADIQAELVKQIVAGNLPAPTTDAAGNVNTYYAVFFPHGLRITQGGSKSCASGGFCAYHGTIDAGGSVGEIYYGVHPDMQAGSGCEVGCGSGATPFDNYTAVASHEMVETITDCEVGLATKNAPPLAWYDNNFGEIGDICNEQQGSVVGADSQTYTVQSEFSNAANECIVSASSMDFGITASSLSEKVRSGRTATFTITVTPRNGFADPVSLSVSDTPNGSTSTFTPNPATTTSTLSIQTKRKAGTGKTHILTIAGNSGDLHHTTTVRLKVSR